MTTSYDADRINFFHLMPLHPDWTQEQLGQAVGGSKSGVYKWQTRFEGVCAGAEGALHEIAPGQSHARKPPSERIEALIRAMRDDPPQGLRRMPGAKALLYSLPSKIPRWESGLRLPTSTRTISQILERNQRLVHRPPRAPQPDLPREAPLPCWPIDFQDVSPVVADPMAPTGKKQHVAEAFNIVDEGTSILLKHEQERSIRSRLRVRCTLMTSEGDSDGT